MVRNQALVAGTRSYLKCTRCGNSGRFIEIMAFESHLVDGNLNYLRLVDAETDRYLCVDCGEQVQNRLGKKPA